MMTMRMLLLVTALCAAAPAGAGMAVTPEAAEASAARSYTVGVENLQYYPLHSTDANNEYTGFAREVLDTFARQQGYTFHYVPLPINRLYTAFLKEQTLDFKYPDHPKWREELRHSLKISYSDVVVRSEEGAMVLPQNKGRPLSTIHSLGTVLGFTPWPYLPAIESKAIVVTTSNRFDGLLRRVLAGQLDAVYVNIDVANYLLAQELKAPGGLQFDPSLPHAHSDFRLSSLRHDEVVAQFSQFLQHEQPLLQQLRLKYKVAEPRPAEAGSR
ncbi:MAG: transporter substrate-binding domain-containing protein [Pseudomonadota bacterium]